MKKKFLPSFELPRLVKTKSTYYILVYCDDKNGLRQRYRRTYNINRILNLSDRVSRGEELVSLIKWWLRRGYYFEDFNERVARLEIRLEREKPHNLDVNLIDAIERVRDQKIAGTDRRSSIRCYENHAKHFIQWLNDMKMEDRSVQEFTRHDARLYVDYWRQKLKIRNPNTFNNKLAFIRGFFNIMVDELEYIEDNPFKKIKRMPKTRSGKNSFDKKDMVTLSVLVKKKNPWLWVATQLAFWGLIRQEELSRLKFSHFNVKNWCIRFKAHETKNKKADTVTLPRFLFEEFRLLKFFEYPSNYFVFSSGIRPGLKMIAERKLQRVFYTVLKNAVNNKSIDNMIGLSFSSWRKSGMNYWSYKLPPRKFKDHNRHDSFSTTEMYLNTRKVISEVSQVEDDIFTT